MRNLNFLRGGTLPNGRYLKMVPSLTGLLKYSACALLVEILESTVSICSSVFLAGQVERPFLSRMFTMSQCLAFSPARLMQQSLAMMLPHQRIRVGSEMERVG